MTPNQSESFSSTDRTERSGEKPWQMRPVLTLTGDYYTVSRVVNRRRVHLEYASDGRPMLYGREQAEAAIKKASA